ncbi:MAG: protein translocase subunit SecD, partial [Clostridia bacterium]
NATKELLNTGVISIWMDETMVSAPSVSAVITDGKGIISGGTSGFTVEDASKLARQINSGALPFKLETNSFSTIDPSMGTSARDAMVLGGAIAFVLVCLFMCIRYKVPGIVASIALLGQVTGSIMAISGYLGVLDSFTLTLPGIAGIVLSIGMGVDANVITNERIKEELVAGKSLDGAIQAGYDNGFSAILDGNVTVIIVAAILMAAFGPTGSFFTTIFSPIFSWFGAATTGEIYSFGYTLLVGVVLNFICGVTCSRLMLKSLSRFKPLRKLSYYGGAKQ